MVVDRLKHNFCGKKIVLATDHKAPMSAMSENRLKKTYQSRLTRWVDKFLPKKFEIVHILGKNMGIVNY